MDRVYPFGFFLPSLAILHAHATLSLLLSHSLLHDERMTTELRQAMVKDISRICENARVSIRSARHEAQKQIKADIDNKIVGTSEGKAETKKVRSVEVRPFCSELTVVVASQMEDATKKWTTEVDQLFQQMKSKVEASMS